MAGMRSPPSSSSLFFPVKGQVSAKRSPPLSLVKMMMVLSAIPAVSILDAGAIRGEAVTPQTDIYSLGIVIYEMLVGQRPFFDVTTPGALIYKHLNEPLPLIGKKGFPAALDSVLATATAKDPTERLG